MADQAQQLAEELQSRMAQVEARVKEFSDAWSLTDDCLNLLTRARVEIAAEHLPEARTLVLRAECLLSQADKSAQTLRKWGPTIGIYEVALLFGLLLLALNGDRWLGWLFGDHPTTWMPIAPYSLWGALGGVVAALFGFYLHAARRDFDRGYVAYYFLKPIMGLVLGPLVYLFARAGLMAIQSQGTVIERPELLYLGAFVLGFGERFSLRLIDRVAAAFFGPGDGGQSVLGATIAGGPSGTPAPPPAAVSLAGPSATGTIRVRVMGPDPGDMEDVSATLLRGDEPVQVKGPPPDEGSAFAFSLLPLGAYQVVASKPGWRQPAPVMAELKSAGEAAEVQVRLEPIVGEPAQPGSGR